MSCDGNDSFGYVKIEDDMVVCYTGESNNPTVHKFCNDDIVHAVKLLEEVKKRFKLEREIYNEEHSAGRYKEDAMMIATTLQGLLEKTEK